METSTVESHQGIETEDGATKFQQKLQNGDGEAAGTQDGPVVDPPESLTAEIVTTPTDAAAAGDIQVTLESQEPKHEEMGNSGSMAIQQVQPAGGDNVAMGFVKTKEDRKKKVLDEVFPANSFTTTEFDGVVKLRMSDTGDCAIKPMTVITMFKQVAEKKPEHCAMGVKRDGKWVTWKYSDYYRDVQNISKSMIALGLEPYHSVGILGFNSPEWFITYLAAMHAGGKAMGIYTTNNPEACQFVLEDSKANLAVVENHVQLQKILKVWDNLPNLKAIIQYTGEVAERRENVYSWEEFMEKGKSVPDSDVEDRLSIQGPNTCCSLIYTSGTTGKPKAVMLSHDNCTWTASRLANVTGFEYGKEVLVTFLPLSHIAAQLLDILVPLKFAFTVYFAQPDALKGSLVDTLKEVRPTGLMTVPRLWEKIQERITAAGRQSGSMKKSIAKWARDKGLKGTLAKMNKQSVPFGWSIANVMVFKKVKKLLGLDRCRIFGSAAAPIMKETLEFFASLDIRLDEVYGMSESTGPHSFGRNDACKLTSVGKEMPGCETRLDKPDEDGNGEVCFWGRHVFMGYLNQPEKTAETMSKDGWLQSGDIGKKDKEGFLYITGRIKELIITAGGENVAPVPIEDAVKEVLPVVSNCMLIGDKKKFLSMLITLKTEVNLDTMEPEAKLVPEAVSWCDSVGAKCTTSQEAIADPNVLKGIQEGIDKANKRAVSRAAIIQKWSILPRDFSVPGGELGPTLKLRRPIVVKMYDKTISGLYED